MQVSPFILVGFLCCVANALSIPPEKKAFKSENSEGGNPRGLSLTTDQNSVVSIVNMTEGTLIEISNTKVIGRNLMIILN